VILRAEVTICGAGIAGIAAAHELAVRRGVRDVVLVDERAPLTLTSDKSTECYRNWWPGPGDAMVRLMNRSIDLLEELAGESGNAFAMNRRGYAFLTARPEQAERFAAAARETSELGAGPLRVHRGAPEDPAYPAFRAEGLAGAAGLDGADLFLDRERIQRLYPGVAADTVAVLNPRRCGWLSAQQLGMLLLERARERGVRLLRGRVTGIELDAGRVAAVRVDPGDPSRPSGGEERLPTGCFVDAAGPHLGAVGRLLGVELPIFNELHGKVSFTDHLGVVPRDLPLMSWSDPVRLRWSEAERRELTADPELAWLLEELPAGVHFRPEGGEDSRSLLLLWTYHLEPRAPEFPPRFDPLYPEVVMRGVARMVPAFGAYLERLERARRPYVDGGYYCKTRENRPLIGPLPVAGAYVLGALSGYGIMAAMGAAELLGAHVAGSDLPSYAPAFRLERYDDPAYQRLLDHMAPDAGQL
jgi:glycine/D-amino acid oxidase-like deaminating enzyme